MNAFQPILYVKLQVLKMDCGLDNDNEDENALLGNLELPLAFPSRQLN